MAMRFTGRYIGTILNIKILAAIWGCLLLSNSLSSKGLTPQEEFDKYKALYPDEVAVYLNKSEQVKIRLIGDSLSIVVYHLEEILHLKESSNFLSKDKIYSSHFSKISDIQARTLVPGKKKYQKIEVTEFKETNSTESYVFYDDSKFIEFVFPSVQIGAKTILSYKETITDPHFLGSFFFQSFLPIEQASLIVEADHSVKLNFKHFNTSSFDLESNVVDNGGTRQYTFSLQRMKKLSFESEAPKINYFAPHINTMISSYKKEDGSQVNVLSGPEDLVDWYKTFVKGKENTSSKEIARIVKEITSEDMSELEKVKSIYYWVQNNIKYIAFEDGMRGFIPHGGNYVCEKRYGDCKDMSSIIINMLREAGITANFTWIGSRDLPYRYEELPSPSSDNHMIATYKSADGDYYFLDATSNYTPFGFPTSMIQGKDALIATAEGYEIVEVPIIPKEKNLIQDKYSYELTKTGIKGSGEVTLSGYPKVFNSHKMIKADAKSTDKYITRLLNRGSNKFFVDNYKIENLSDLDQPIKVKYDFRVEDCYSKVGDEIYININLEKTLNGAYIEDRELPLEKDYKFLRESVSTFKIPEGYQVKFLPENEAFNNEIFGFELKYTQEGNSIKVERYFYQDFLMLYQENFSLWNEAIKKFTEANRQVVILTKSS